MIRFWNNEILGNVEGVVAAIAAAVSARLPDGEQIYFSGSRAGRPRNPRSRGKKTRRATPNPSSKSWRGIAQMSVVSVTLNRRGWL